MFFFFSFFAFSVFVPYSKTVLPAVHQLNDETFRTFKPTHQTLIALIIPDNYPIERQTFMLTLFSSAIPFYSDIANFVFFKSSEAPTLVSSIPASLPAVVFFFKARLVFSCPLPMSETTLSYLLGSWLDPDYGLAKTKEDLYSALCGVPLAMITKENLAVNASFHLVKALPQIGSCILVKVTEQLFNEIVLENGRNRRPMLSCDYAMFRLSDRTIMPIYNEYDVNITESGIYNASKPFFCLLTENMITTHDQVYAVYFDLEYNESKYSDILYRLAEKHYMNRPNLHFQFVVVTPENFHYISQVTRDNITAPNFLVFSYFDGYYYPHNDDLTGFDMTENRWLEVANDYLSDIENGKINRKYFSEKEETEPLNGLTKVVGSTYPNFVNDPDNDVLMLFYDNQEKGEDAIKQYKIFSNILKCDNLKVGYINIAENSSPQRYPILFDVPMVCLFPAKNKTDVRPMFYTISSDNIFRFVNSSMTLSHESFNFPELDTTLAQMELFMFSLQAQRMPLVYREQALQHAKQLQAVVYGGSMPYDSFESDQNQPQYDEL